MHPCCSTGLHAGQARGGVGISDVEITRGGPGRGPAALRLPVTLDALCPLTCCWQALPRYTRAVGPPAHPVVRSGVHFISKTVSRASSCWEVRGQMVVQEVSEQCFWKNAVFCELDRGS